MAEQISRRKIVWRILYHWLRRTIIVLSFMGGFIALLYSVLGELTISQLLSDLFSPSLFRDFAQAAWTSFQLIGASLLLSLALSLGVGWLRAMKQRGSGLIIPVTIFSAVPVFLYAAITHAFKQTGFYWAVLILGVGNLSLSVLTRRISAGLRNELSSLHISMARVKHVPLWTHYWRPLLAHVLTTIRPMIPYYVSAAVVVEWKFNIYGLGYLAYTKASSYPAELAPVVWVCFLVVCLVRFLQLAEEITILCLIPQHRQEVEDSLLLFSMEEKFQGDLRGNMLSKSLQQEFDNNGCSLSKSATISNRRKGGGWLITNQETKQTYIIKKEESQLNVYRTRTAFQRLKDKLRALRLMFQLSYNQNSPPQKKLKHDISEYLKKKTFVLRSTRKYWMANFIHRLGLIGVCLLILTSILFTISIFHTIFGWPTWEDKSDLSRSMEQPKFELSEDLLGRDLLGRSVVARLLKATIPYTLPLLLGVLAASIPGILLAVFSTSQLKKVRREIVDPLIEMLDALPKLIVLLVVVSKIPITGAYHYLMMPIMGLLFIPDIYHSIKERILYFQRSGFVEAAKALGASVWKIVFSNILWNNCRDVLFVQISHILGSLIILDATLAYLELNQPDYPTWGSLVKASYKYIQDPNSNPFTYIAPTVAIVLTLVAINLVSEAAHAGMKGQRMENV